MVDRAGAEPGLLYAKSSAFIAQSKGHLNSNIARAWRVSIGTWKMYGNAIWFSCFRFITGYEIRS